MYKELLCLACVKVIDGGEAMNYIQDKPSLTVLGLGGGGVFTVELVMFKLTSGLPTPAGVCQDFYWLTHQT